jgi:hypothetical protein
MTITSALLVDEVRKHDSGQVDLIGLFEDIYIDRVPVHLESINLFVDLEFSPDDRGRRVALELHVIAPDGTPGQKPTLVRFVVPTFEQFPKNNSQLDLALFEVPIHAFGPHHIRIVADEKTLRTIPLHVHPRETDSGNENAS